MTTADWRPGASVEVLELRAKLLARIRGFFADRRVMEVETPLLASAGVTDPHLRNLLTTCHLSGEDAPRTFYLQTSPEYAMKRLLAVGCGPIYQIGRAFRDGEAGRLHNPEFTMVEWYRPGFDYQDLMEDVEDLLIYTLGVASCSRITYQAAFERHAGLNPHTASIEALHRAVADLGVDIAGSTDLSRDDYLDLLLSHVVAPRLGRVEPAFLCNYPAGQAALARLIPGDPPVAARFEVFINGLEIANGFQELTDPVEQRRRFEADLIRRRESGLPAVPIDERLLAALEAGIPNCAGVALGFDRLAMIAAQRNSIDEIQAFSIARA